MSKGLIPEFYVDELAGIMIGYPTSKLTFASIKQVGANGEIEKSNVLTVVIPTQILINACNFTTANIQANQSGLLAAALASSENMSSAIQSITLPSTEKAVAEKKKQKR